MRKIALVTLLILPVCTVEAGGISSIWDEMLSASSGINQYSGARRNGISLGSASVRIKTVNEQVLAARAPYLQASCKGIDFFGGSLSLIKREELVQMARSIAAAAPMYAFQLAMGMLCPDCNAILADLAKRLNSLNEYISKDCEEWVDLAEKEVPSLQVKSDRKMWQNYSESSSGWFDSKASARAEVSAISSHSKAAKMTNTESKSQYNSVYQAFMDGGVTMPLLSSDKTVVAQMVMSVFGTNIYKFDSSLTVSETDGSDAINTSIAPQIRLRDLYVAEAPDVPVAKKMVVCVTAATTDPNCLSAAVKDVGPNDPRYLDSFYRLYGDAICGLMDSSKRDSSIVAIYARKGTYSAQQDIIMRGMNDTFSNILENASNANMLNNSNCKFISEYLALTATLQLIEDLRVAASNMKDSDTTQRSAYLANILDKIKDMSQEKADIESKITSLNASMTTQFGYISAMKTGQ